MWPMQVALDVGTQYNFALSDFQTIFFVKTFVNILFGRHFHVFAAMFTAAGTRTNGTCIFFRASFTLILRVRRARFPVLLIRGSWPAPGDRWKGVGMGLAESRSVCPQRAPAGQGPCWPGSRHAQVVPARTCPMPAAQQWQ